LADYIEGTVAALQGEQRRAASQLASAVSGFDGVRAGLHAAASRRRLALLDGREGARIAATAEQWFRGQGIVSVARLSRAFAPGFCD
jgi:hypothetical protein